jgi:hypothetical protein
MVLKQRSVPPLRAFWLIESKALQSRQTIVPHFIALVKRYPSLDLAATRLWRDLAQTVGSGNWQGAARRRRYAAPNARSDE